MSGVVQELTNAHYFYFTACHDWKRELIEQYPRMLVERAVDGFLLLNTPADQIEVPVPVVAISAHSEVQNVTNIVLDHHKAVETALVHLYDLGHRRIAFMRGPRPSPTPTTAGKASSKSPAKSACTIDPALVIRIDSAGWSMKTGQHPMAPEIGYKPMQSLLEKTRDFTAIFCFNDIAAIGAIRALKDAGLPFLKTCQSSDSMTFNPPLTPRRRSPRCASHSLKWASAERRFCSNASPIAKATLRFRIVMAPELVVRESTGPAQR